jgi:hypothetical protein
MAFVYSKTPTNELRTLLFTSINPDNAPGNRPEFIEGLSIPVSQNNAGEYLYPSGNLHIPAFKTACYFFRNTGNSKRMVVMKYCGYPAMRKITRPGLYHSLFTIILQHDPQRTLQLYH